MDDAVFFTTTHDSASHIQKNNISMDFVANLHNEKPEKLQNEPKKGF